jgi:DNA-binding MarR family transcriptional regulator
VTKPTVSDAVRVLVVKKYLKKNYSTIDKRKFDLRLSASGQELVKELMDYRTSISDELEGINAEALETTFKTLSKLIYQLNKKGLIQVQRTCFACKFYDGDKQDSHHCKLLNIKLLNQDIKIDCSDFEVKLAS